MQVTLPASWEFCIAAQPPPTYPSPSEWIFPLQFEFACDGSRTVLQSVLPGLSVAVGQLMSPRVGSLKATNVHNGEAGPLVPVGLSGLEASRQSGLQTFKLVSGLALHEQLVWRISYELSIVTVVCAPSFDAPCAVASMVKPFSEAIVRMSPLLRKGRLYATVGPPEP